MRKLKVYLSELEVYSEYAETKHLLVSSATVGWHVEHTLLVIIKTIDAIKNSDPHNYKWRFNLARFIVFSINKIPRGKGKAPEIVQPEKQENINFNKLLDRTRVALNDFKNFHPNQFVKHPVFGLLNKKQAGILLDIHTRHHLLIINDILSKN